MTICVGSGNRTGTARWTRLVHDSRAVRRRTQDLLPPGEVLVAGARHHLRDHLVDEKVVEFIEGQENVT